jgi:hypothetical protein
MKVKLLLGSLIGLSFLFSGVAETPDAGESKKSVDEFGLAMLYPSVPGGRAWTSRWNNGKERIFKESGNRDPFDEEFIMRGDGEIKIDGKGIVRISGPCPRLYVYDEPRKKKWCNVEVTFYFKRLKETAEKLSYRGFAIGVRSNHQDAAEKMSEVDGLIKCPALGAGYYGKILYDGRVVFQKELVHHSKAGYSVNKPKEGDRRFWNTPDRSLPPDIWIGMKFIVRNAPGNTVKLELYRDLTDGKDGGQWEKLIEYTDKGGWTNPLLTKEIIEQSTQKGLKVIAVDEVLRDPGTSVFIRNDGLVAAECKKFSIREIAPLE